MVSGRAQRFAVSQGSFSPDLLSGFMGRLMPYASYKLIPMAAFPNLTLEMQTSPWAVFTSGYCNSNLNSQAQQPKRQF